VNYLYDVFGLIVRSDILFPELPVSSELVCGDVSIVLSDYLGDIRAPVTESAHFSVNHVQTVLKGDGFDLTVKNGCEIRVHNRKIQDWEEVRLRILGAAFGVLLQQRGMLVLHGATIVGKKGALVLLGHSGDGKSTLTGQLVGRGYQSMGDDKAIISVGVSCMVLPSFPYIKLSRSSAMNLGFSDSAIRTITRSHIKKYINLGDQFFFGSAPLKGLFVLGQSKDAAVEELPKEQAFSSLIEQSYRRRKLFGMGVHTEHFLQCGQLAQRFPVFSYQRSFGDGNLREPDPQFLDQVEALIGYE
tara:strand:+ start:4472 stop:5374 length:903 start_codon:yes stop_codon:yes gene_type:complete